MGTKKYKSLFILHVYKFEPCKKPAYRIDKEDVKQKGYAEPGFGIYELETGIFETLAQAEKQIRKLANGNDIYGFLIEEKPVGGTFYTGDALSRRRYLRDGKLWQKCEVSGIRRFNGKNDESDDAYTVAYYNVSKDGEIGYGHTHPAVVNVLPPSFPVPRKFATELRRRLKMSQDECEQYENEYGNDIPF